MHPKKPVEIRKTVCNRDCPDACGIVATVEDGRVVRLQGDPDYPVTRAQKRGARPTASCACASPTAARGGAPDDERVRLVPLDA